MKKILNIIYPFQSVPNLYIGEAPITRVNNVVYIYDKESNTFTPKSWKHMKLNPEISYADIDKFFIAIKDNVAPLKEGKLLNLFRCKALYLKCCLMNFTSGVFYTGPSKFGDIHFYDCQRKSIEGG